VKRVGDELRQGAQDCGQRIRLRQPGVASEGVAMLLAASRLISGAVLAGSDGAALLLGG
jgi:hypothetical protein